MSHEPDDTAPFPAAPSTIPSPPPTFDLFDSIEQLPDESGVRLNDPWALRFDWDGFASPALDEE
jgi:hypothetical protein